MMKMNTKTRRGSGRFFGLAMFLAIGALGCDYQKSEQLPSLPTAEQQPVISGDKTATPAGEAALTVFCSVVPSQGTVTAGKTLSLFVTLINAAGANVTFGSQTFSLTASQTVTPSTNDPGNYPLSGQAIRADGTSVPCVVALSSITVLSPDVTPPADTTPPTVSATDPANGTTGVATTAKMTISFSEPVEPLTPANFSVAGTVTMPNETTAQLVPSSAFAGGQSVTVTTSAVKDKAGNVMSVPYSFSFTTEAGTTGGTGTTTTGTTTEPVAQGELTPLPGDLITQPLSPSQIGKVRDVIGTSIPTSPTTCPEGDVLKDGKCVLGSFDVDGVKLMIQIGHFSQAGSIGNFEINLCPDTNFPDSPSYTKQCYVATFDGQKLVMNELKKLVTIDLGAASMVTAKTDLSLANLKYPDHFKFFRLLNNSTDNLFISGIELQARKKGQSQYVPIYRNPFVNRWIDFLSQKVDRFGKITQPETWHPSVHSLEDDAFGYYLQTCNLPEAGTKDTIAAVIPLKASLGGATQTYLNSVYSSQSDEKVSYDDSSFRIGLDWTSDGYVDRAMNGRTSYGMTVYHGQDSLKEEYWLHNYKGTDEFAFCDLEAYHVKPGDSEFLRSQNCLYDTVSASGSPIALLPDPAKPVTDSSRYFYPSSGDTRKLQPGTCLGLDTIQFGLPSGQDAERKMGINAFGCFQGPKDAPTHPCLSYPQLP